MRHSPEFDEFTAQFYQDLMDDVSSEDEIIQTVLYSIKNDDNRTKLGSFLEKITGNEISDKELRRLWWSSSADIMFYDGAELRAFLKRVRARL